LIGTPGHAVQRPSTELVDLFYEMNKKCLIGPVIMDYNSLLKPPLLEFYTYPQAVRGGKYFVEFYGKERYISRIMDEVGINIDQNITQLRITLTDDQLSINTKNYVYPEVKTIAIHSQLTRTPRENDSKSR
jgi:hypothetical protein